MDSQFQSAFACNSIFLIRIIIYNITNYLETVPSAFVTERIKLHMYISWATS